MNVKDRRIAVKSRAICILDASKLQKIVAKELSVGGLSVRDCEPHTKLKNP